MSDYTHIPIPDIEHWTTEQVLAVYDLCQSISATLMARYEDQLIEMMTDIDQRLQTSDSSFIEQDNNLQLPFDDPF